LFSVLKVICVIITFLADKAEFETVMLTYGIPIDNSSKIDAPISNFTEGNVTLFEAFSPSSA